MPGPGSPAIDGGDNGVCPPVDILGALRPADGNGDGSPVCDIGAYYDSATFAPNRRWHRRKRRCPNCPIVESSPQPTVLALLYYEVP